MPQLNHISARGGCRLPNHTTRSNRRLNLFRRTFLQLSLHATTRLASSEVPAASRAAGLLSRYQDDLPSFLQDSAATFSGYDVVTLGVTVASIVFAFVNSGFSWGTFDEVSPWICTFDYVACLRGCKSAVDSSHLRCHVCLSTISHHP